VNEFKRQLTSALFVIFTVAAVICAAVNFDQQHKFLLPEDGVTWTERAPDGRTPQVVALHVEPDSPGAKAGIRSGDVLLKINGVTIDQATDVPSVLVRLGVWSKGEYQIARGGVETKATVIVRQRQVDTAVYYQYPVGLAYLAIGLFVYFRRGRAGKSTHFFLLCLLSFVFSTFHYTGKLNGFDKLIFWGNVFAGLAVPAIFIHFCISFPDSAAGVSRWTRAAIYGPPTALFLVYVLVATGSLRTGIPLIELLWLLDRIWMPLLMASYLAGGLVLQLKYRKTQDSVVRQQLKWLRNGAILGALPFTLLYVVPYTLGVVPGPAMKLAVLSLPLIPLTWAYAIIRYRLMDVDVIFQQGYVYTLATLAVIGVFYGLVFSLGRLDDIDPSNVVILMALATFVFQPIRNYLQELFDRHYLYKDRYDYRRTLVEFSRELSSETDLERMLGSVSERLLGTLSIQHTAVFLHDEEDGVFRLHHVAGHREHALPMQPDLSFLAGAAGKPYLFFERTRHNLDIVFADWPPSVRQTIADLDLTYYLPCAVRGRTIAYLGVSRTAEGDFLSSDDLELLMTLAANIGIAIENSRLYRSLQAKIAENERLREFNENIVESINVGILAAGLDDRIGSWNHQIEALTGISREQAMGRRLRDIFPDDLAQRFDAASEETGIHRIDKFALRLPANGHGPREAMVNIAIAPLVSKEQERIGRLIIFDDITDRFDLERQLVQADKLSSIGLLAAGVAHEVNTPLAVISTYAQMLAKQVNGDEQKSKLLEKIARQTFRASEIVNSLLNFSRTSTTELGPVDLNRVIRDTVSLIDHQLQKAHVVVETALAEGLPGIRGNAGKLQQIFLNLFLNARDAMETGGRLVIRTAADGDTVRVSVTDTGTGIPPDVQARIFDPFFTTKGHRKGTGLGLSVTYGIVQEHGGAIRVQSAPGRGSTFDLEFPAARRGVAV